MEIKDIAKFIENELNTFEKMYQECKESDIATLSDILSYSLSQKSKKISIFYGRVGEVNVKMLQNQGVVGYDFFTISE